jgi:hypothetical protein
MEADEVRGEFPPEDRSSSLLKSAGQENKEVPISGTIEKGGSPVCFIRASEDEWKDKKPERNRSGARSRFSSEMRSRRRNEIGWPRTRAPG